MAAIVQRRRGTGMTASRAQRRRASVSADGSPVCAVVLRSGCCCNKGRADGALGACAVDGGEHGAGLHLRGVGAITWRCRKRGAQAGRVFGLVPFETIQAKLMAAAGNGGLALRGPCGGTAPKSGVWFSCLRLWLHADAL